MMKTKWCYITALWRKKSTHHFYCVISTANIFYQSRTNEPKGSERSQKQTDTNINTRTHTYTYHCGWCCFSLIQNDNTKWNIYRKRIRSGERRWRRWWWRERRRRRAQINNGRTRASLNKKYPGQFISTKQIYFLPYSKRFFSRVYLFYLCHFYHVFMIGCKRNVFSILDVYNICDGISSIPFPLHTLPREESHFALHIVCLYHNLNLLTLCIYETSETKQNKTNKKTIRAFLESQLQILCYSKFLCKRNEKECESHSAVIKITSREERNEKRRKQIKSHRIFKCFHLWF